MSKIEKYVGYYLLVYLLVLSFCAFFQYFSVCQGKSLECIIKLDGMNTIITTTAYVLTPIVAIIGFLSWKNQKVGEKNIETLDKLADFSDELSIAWLKTRENMENNFYLKFYLTDIDEFKNLQKPDPQELSSKISDIMRVESIIQTIKIHTNRLKKDKVDVSEIDKQLDRILNQLNNLNSNIFNIYNFNTVEENYEFYIKTCIECDRYCNKVAPNKLNEKRIDHDQIIRDYHNKLLDTIYHVKSNIE